MSHSGTLSAALCGPAKPKQSLNPSMVGAWLRTSRRGSDGPSGAQQWDPGGCTNPLHQCPLVRCSTAIPKASPQPCWMVTSAQEPVTEWENQMAPAASGLQ